MIYPKNLKSLLSILLLLGHYLGFAQSTDKPNILFIMSDDHTSTAIGAYGSRLAKLNPTPTIDQIASEGMLMENTFCNNAICSPSRATILTGQYSSINGVTGLGGKLPEERQYLPIEMKKAGYETAVIGKWHLGTMPLAFDYYKVMHSQGHYFNPIFTEKGKPIQEFKLNKDKTEKGSVRIEGHSTDVIADSGIDWLKNRDNSKPFFLKLHFKAPHGPFDNAPRYDDYLADIKIPEPDNYRDRKNNGSIATRGYNDELMDRIGSSVDNRNKFRSNVKLLKDKRKGLSEEEITTESYQNYLKKYLRCVKGVDDNVKKVIEYLKAECLYENTVIIYTGDQGFYLGEHNFIDKRWGYEEGMRMPFIVRYPKTIKAGSRSDAITENVDFAPTILDFAGAATPPEMQGKSFKSILETGKEPKDWKKGAYYHYQLHMAHHLNPAHIGIRTKDYKLLLFYGAEIKSDTPNTPPAWELYDLKKDPTEDNNVYNDPKYAKIITTLKEELKTLRKTYKVDGEEFVYNKVIEEYWDYTEEDYQKSIKISSQAKDYLDNTSKATKKYRRVKAKVDK